jgi:hypothetical protein
VEGKVSYDVQYVMRKHVASRCGRLVAPKVLGMLFTDQHDIAHAVTGASLSISYTHAKKNVVFFVGRSTTAGQTCTPRCQCMHLSLPTRALTLKLLVSH